MAGDLAGRFDGVRVLVVEDDPDSSEMLCELLRLSGVECEAAPDAAMARHKLATLPWVPDVVISDIGLPGEDGYSLARWIRQRPPPPPPPPLIAFTALVDREATKAAGFYAHVVKPIQIEALFDALGAVLATKNTP